MFISNMYSLQFNAANPDIKTYCVAHVKHVIFSTNFRRIELIFEVGFGLRFKNILITAINMIKYHQFYFSGFYSTNVDVLHNNHYEFSSVFFFFGLALVRN